MIIPAPKDPEHTVSDAQISEDKDSEDEVPGEQNGKKKTEKAVSFEKNFVEHAIDADVAEAEDQAENEAGEAFQTNTKEKAEEKA